MVFSSTTFLFLFLPALLAVYYFPKLKNRTFRNVVLLLFSLGFYAWGEPLFVFVMLMSIVMNWGFGLLIENAKNNQSKKRRMIIATVINLSLLFVFKYLSFVSENIVLITGNNRFLIEIALPIGISFYTFQIMSYIFDVYYGKIHAQRKLLCVALYASLFPQLIAGPIVRYSDIEHDLLYREETKNDFTEGMMRFIFGLGKKVLLANYLGLAADAVFGTNGSMAVMTAWFGAITYALQIYFDFSGYSDMAIGLGKMFGFHFPENFNYPYIAKSVTDFWRRWHISLSSWFRDYVYIPLGGNRVKKSKWIINLFLVWLFTGIWHGANWTFVIWGLFYFVILLAEKLTGTDKPNRHSAIAHIYTLLIILLAWVLFRSESLPLAIGYLGSMFGANATCFADAYFLDLLNGYKWILLCAVILCTPVCKKAAAKIGENQSTILRVTGNAIVLVLSILACVKMTYNPFIYFNF